MNKNHSVGVAMITQNHENYIQNAIDSLLNQSLLISNITVVDDCSSDNTYSVLEKIAKKNNTIRIIRNPHILGPSASSNKALSNLNDDFILYTSGDDLSHRNRAKIQVDFLVNRPDLDCVANTVNVFTTGDSLLRKNVPHFNYSDSEHLDLFKELFFSLNFINASAVCFRNSNLMKDFFSIKYLFLQDYHAWLNLSLKNKLALDNELVLDYRVTINSLSQQVNGPSNHFKEVMNKELFDILYSSLENLPFNLLLEIFNKEIGNYRKSELDDSARVAIIYYILLSHNSYDVRESTLHFLRKRDNFAVICKEIENFFRVEPQSLFHIVDC
jgi:glycosyltransferase EpsE